MEFVLVPGPLVRGSSWEPTAEHLRAAGHRASILDALDTQEAPPAWRAWASRLAEMVPPGDPAVLVGHSSATTLAAELATKAATAGIVFVDGEVPPSYGLAPPVRPALHEHIKTLAGPDGELPIWSRWFAGDPQRQAIVGLDVLGRDPVAFAAFEAELPRMHVDWFADTVDLADWSHVPTAYIQTSVIYNHAIAAARRRGWPTIALQGTHLHPTLEPEEMAKAILSVTARLGLSAG